MDRPGVKKEIDALGRICIPKEIRALFGLKGVVELVATRDGVLVRSPRYMLCEIDEADNIDDSLNSHLENK